MTSSSSQRNNRMSGYIYNQYNPAYDAASDRNSQIFFDALSIASGSDRNSIALSIYHSVPDMTHQDDYDSKSVSQYLTRGNGTSSGGGGGGGGSGSGGGGVYARGSKIWHDFQDEEEINKSVDFILAYNSNDQLNKIKRQIYERNLVSEGLVLERDESQSVHFLKIHATFEVLCRYSEILKFKFPIKLDENENEDQLENERQRHKMNNSIFGKLFRIFRLDRKLFPEKRYELFHEFSRDKSYLFDMNDPHFFPNFVRFSCVNFILERTTFSDSVDDNCVGIDKLLADSAYTAAYPLHDGHKSDTSCQRGLLYKEWAELKNWLKHQPLDTIKNYFGVKVALYFSWLGFYTSMLIGPSILGLVVFLFGVATMFTNSYTDQICNANETVLLCPKCDDCEYTLLRDTCVYARINHILDNNVTIFFAVCMGIWAAIYLELWKRSSATIIHRWGATDYSRESEHARPAYLARVKNKKQARNKLNPITRQHEPTLSFKFKVPSYLLSYSIIVLYILLSIAVVVALIIFRMATLSSKRLLGSGVNPLSYQHMILLPVTTSIINLVVITILNYLYDYLAVFLTDLEYRRTQTDYDNSLSLKIYLFQFINYYSSLFYIAFLKGKWPGTPAKYNRIFSFRQEECSPGGCLMELFIQLAIIMIGKQAINAIVENLSPWLIKQYKKLRYGKEPVDDETGLEPNSQWTKDFKLMAWTSMGLFSEYLEMVLQFGFCTLFVIAFPLGPMFALLNNIMELRLDARKFLVYYRRPVPRRQSDIGIWLTVMSVLGKMSVLTTAFIIAFSTNFIPRLVHDLSPELSKMDYLEFTLAYFNTSDFEPGSKPENSTFGDPEICRYPEFRNGPDPSPLLRYKRPYHYWKILTARLAFIIVYQNVVAWIQQFIDWVIPDKPEELDSLIKRESYLVSTKVIQEERTRVLQYAQRKKNEIDYVNGGVYFEAKS